MTVSAKPRLLLLMCGQAQPEVVAVGGDYDQWFARGFGDLAVLERRDVFRDQPLGNLDGYDGVVVSGSTSSVCERAPWMERTGDELANAALKGHAVLGVCFGHQLLAQALGGDVVEHPRGREIGTIAVELTPEGQRDPVFLGLPASARFNATHGDHVPTLPPEARLLASNAHSAVQAFRVGPRALAVQFHPELDADTMRAMIRRRHDELVTQAGARGEDGEATFNRLLESVEASSSGPALLASFVRTLR